MKSLKLTAYKAPLELVDEPTPRPTGTQVLLRVRAAGVCHSDLHLQEGGYDLGNGRTLSLKDRGVTLPRTLGHETVGEIVSWGEEVTDLAAGQVRLIYPWIGCGECPACLRGDENLCIGAPRVLGVHRDGGFADHILVPHPRYLVDTQGIAPEAAAPLACSGLTAYAAVRKVREVALRKPVVLIGAGGVGQTAIGLLRAIGGVGAVVVDISADKRQSAAAAGAIATVDANAPDAMALVQAAVGAPVEAVFDFVGAPQSAALAFDLVVKGGKLVMVGLYGGATPWSLPLIPMKALTIEGSYVGNLAEMRELVALVAGGSVPRVPLDVRPLAEGNAAMADLHAGRIAAKAVLRP